jgi:hypothetical protein
VIPGAPVEILEVAETPVQLANRTLILYFQI